MPYGQCKIYSDGNHYIAIPHTERLVRRRRPRKEEIITVREKATVCDKNSASVKTDDDVLRITEPNVVSVADTNASVADKAETSGTHSSPLPETETRMTKKELFDKLYDEYIELSRSKRKEAVLAEMLPYFKNESNARLYVDGQFERKQRNLISRRMRLARKVNMQEFDHFVTFTYSDKLHTEESFRKKLRNTLSHLCSRKGWRYVGVWERSPEKKRLHFHGLLHVPEGTMPGEMNSVSSYSFSSHARQVTHQNSYFLEQFGRNDFEDITDARRIGDAIAYLTKYIEKFGEKIVYSRGLYAYFISDIMAMTWCVP